MSYVHVLDLLVLLRVSRRIAALARDPSLWSWWRSDMSGMGLMSRKLLRDTTSAVAIVGDEAASTHAVVRALAPENCNRRDEIDIGYVSQQLGGLRVSLRRRLPLFA